MFEYQYTNNGVKYSAPNGMHDDAVCSLALANKKFLASLSFGQYAIL
jgi:hypothetical protein